MSRVWSGLGRLIVRRSGWLLVGAIAATLVLAAGLPGLRFSSSQDSLIPSGSPVRADNVRFQRQFAGEPVLVLFTGDVHRLVEPGNARALDALERALLRDPRIDSVLSPLTSLRFAAAQVPLGAQLVPAADIRAQATAAATARSAAARRGADPAAQDAAAQRAADQVSARFAARIGAEAVRLGKAGEATLTNPAFFDFLLRDDRGAIRSEVKAQFPDANHALMVVRLAGNMSIDDQSRAANHVVDVVRAHPLRGIAELPSGPAILLAEVNDGMRGAMARMGALAVGAMALVLLLVLRVRWRLLSLGIVVTGCVWAFGLLGYLGFTLTMVTISALPVLIGLGVDFAIQMHSRFEEEAARAGDPGAAVGALMTGLGLPLAVAMLAAVAGFLALHLSPVPMIRDFGLMLAIGAFVLFVASLLLPVTLLFRREVRSARRPRVRPARESDPSRSRVAGAVRFLTRIARGSVAAVIVVTIVIAGAGLVADRGTNVQSDPEGFIPQNSPVLADLRRIRDVSGSSQELGFLVEAPDVTRPAVLAWMSDFEQRELARHPHALLTSASIASIARDVTGTTPTPSDVAAILRVAPASFTKTFVNRDHTAAHVIFAIGPISLLDQKRLLATVERDFHAPRGVRVTAGGLAIVGIAAVDALNANRTLMIYLALGVVFLWLVAFTRSVRWALLPIMPVLVAVGTAAIATRVLGVHLSPLSAVCGPIIVATCTEFSVLIMARYIEERERGADPEAALDRASGRIGVAFAASGLTVVGGFGALAFSGFPLLDSFGVVVALNVAVALVSALVVLPPLLLWLDRRIGLARVERHLWLAPGPAKGSKPDRVRPAQAPAPAVEPEVPVGAVPR